MSMTKPFAYNIYGTTGAAWDAMYASLETAKTSIYWEVYIFIDDAEGKRFSDILEKKAIEGLEVKLIVDTLGSLTLSKKTISRLKKAGVEIIFFYERKKRIRSWWQKLWTRNHRKMLIIDRESTFIGGVNIEAGMKDWFDIMIEIKGDISKQFLPYFAQSYLISGGKRSHIKHLFARQEKISIRGIDFVFDEPSQKRSRARRYYLRALRDAKKKIILFSPYFFPDKGFLRAMKMARKRGVRIDMIMPFRTDLKLVTYAAQSWYQELSDLGIHIHLLHQMMHGKGLIVDDSWAMAGSSNINHTSFYETYESNIRIEDHDMVRSLTKEVLGWLPGSTHIDNMYWEDRSLFEKVKENMALWLYRLWYWRS